EEVFRLHIADRQSLAGRWYRGHDDILEKEAVCSDVQDARRFTALNSAFGCASLRQNSRARQEWLQHPCFFCCAGQRAERELHKIDAFFADGFSQLGSVLLELQSTASLGSRSRTEVRIGYHNWHLS